MQTVGLAVCNRVFRVQSGVRGHRARVTHAPREQSIWVSGPCAILTMSVCKVRVQNQGPFVDRSVSWHECGGFFFFAVSVCIQMLPHMKNS